MTQTPEQPLTSRASKPAHFSERMKALWLLTISLPPYPAPGSRPAGWIVRGTGQ